MSGSRSWPTLAAALSHVRATAGRARLGVDLHLWVRELTRIDRVASSAARYLWSDDGTLTDDSGADAGAATALPSPPSTAGTAAVPAGASAWPRSGRTSTPTTPRSAATTPPARAVPRPALCPA